MGKIPAFRLRRKVSKTGTEYFIAPLGEVDLFAIQDKGTGDIRVFYSPREMKSQEAYKPNPTSQAPRPMLTPRGEHVAPPNQIGPEFDKYARAYRPKDEETQSGAWPEETPWQNEPEVPF